PLRPDRLGETLVAQTLTSRRDGGRALLHAITQLPDGGQVTRAFRLLARLTRADTTVAATVAATLATCHTRLVDRALAAARGTPDQPGRPDLATSLIQLLTSDITSRIEEHTHGTTHTRRLANSYTKLADLACATGQSTEAERLY